ncbi:hypothetical protein, partial [Klebsiella pneumoniae]|uniref:hypothetical protein n=1 Tax=Klebsiella pneumoniae TaxID=573 RepID=UPI00254FF24E
FRGGSLGSGATLDLSGLPALDIQTKGELASFEIDPVVLDDVFGKVTGPAFAFIPKFDLGSPEVILGFQLITNLDTGFDSDFS